MNFFKYLQSVVTTFLNRNKAWITAVLDTLFALIALVSLGLVFVKYFLSLDSIQVFYVNQLSYRLLILYVGQECLRLIFPRSIINHLKQRWFELLIALLCIGYISLSPESIRSFISTLSWLKVNDVTFFILGVTQLSVFIKNMSFIFNKLRFINFFQLTPSQVFIVSFITPIFIGAALLKLPKATVTDISWIDAFFTAASAVCVTGLTTLSTGDDFTLLGQIIICFLFQIGGLGIMTLTVAFATLLSGRMGLGQNTLMSDMLNVEKIGEVKNLLKRIFIFTIIIELIGVLFLYKISNGFTAELNLKSLYYSVFHAISAFCNAGFSLNNNSLMGETIPFNFIITILVILGGLGFPVLSNMADIVKYKVFGIGDRKVVTLHSKIVLSSTAILLVGGTIFIFLFENQNLLKSYTLFEKLFHSYFLSTISRTAGFNSIATEMLSFSTLLIVFLLMWIGAAPMSTAGGVKSVTVFVALKNVLANLRGESQVTMFERAIAKRSVDRAFVLIILSVFTIFTGFLLVSHYDPHINKIDLFFETISAWGTVGLSRGVTSSLSTESKSVLICLMIVGRVGMITFVMSLISVNKRKRYKYLDENVIMH